MKLKELVCDVMRVSVLWALAMGLYWVECRLVDEPLNWVVSVCAWVALFIHYQMVKFDIW